MEMSVREAKARFAEAANAAASGERVIITKHGIPFVEIVPAAVRPNLNAGRLAEIRTELGLLDQNADWFDDFISNPKASRQALGLDD